YNSHEERAMIQRVSGNENVPGVVVGIGSDVPQAPQPGRFRQKYDVRVPFAVYVGRIDENKGCKELFDFFQGYLRDGWGQLSLVLIGNSLLPIPNHPRIRHLGFLDDADKFDAMAAADLLIMPSYFESLSMVALEAWALGRPVLANGKCDVLRGQCVRSNAGLYYATYAEFIESLSAMERNRWLSAALGHEVLGIQRVLRGAGYRSEIFVETADHRLESLTRDYRELIDFSRPDNLLIHHFSLGSRASRIAYALPERMALVYHNITP